MAVNYERIKDLCDKKGTNIKSLETDNGIGNSTVRKWGSEGNSPRLDKLETVAKYLNTSVSYLIGETDDPIKVKIYQDTRLSEQEEELLHYFRLLNDNGIELVLDFAKNISENNKYASHIVYVSTDRA